MKYHPDVFCLYVSYMGLDENKSKGQIKPKAT